MTTADEIRCLPIDAWPAPDRTRWEAATAPGDLLDPGGPLSSLAARTLRGIAQSYGRWLTWHDGHGRLGSAVHPALRVTPEHLTAYVAELQQRNAPYTVCNRIRDLLLAMRGMAPAYDWTFLERAHARLRAQAQAAGDKRQRLRAIAELFDLGLRLMQDAERADRLAPVKRAARFRDGLMVALLAARPLRLGNFAAVRLGHHLIQTDGGWMLRFEAAETKQRRPISVSVPASLVPWLERYLEHHRPVLVARINGRSRGRHDGLWVSQFGTQVTAKAIHKMICRITQAAFGRPVNPHLFRNCAATSIALEDPEHVRMAATILGHVSFATTERHYNQARSVEAARHFQGVIGNLRTARKP